MSSVTRAALVVLAGHVVSIARPIAIAVFAHAYGAGSRGSFTFVLACVELGSRLATTGLD